MGSRLLYDFAAIGQSQRFPSHGWARNSQGVKILWLPIIRCVHNSWQLRKTQGLAGEPSAGQWADILRFEETIKKLARALRELHERGRLCARDSMGINDADEFNQFQNAADEIPLYLDLVYIYLRRLADDWTRASRHALFEKSGEADGEFKNLRKKAIAQHNQLARLLPLGDVAQLESALNDHAAWFTRLRSNTDDNGRLKRGLRDLMEHQSVTMDMQIAKNGDEPWRVEAYLHESLRLAIDNYELVSGLHELIADLCSFWTAVVISLDWDGRVGLPCNLVNSGYGLWVAPFGDSLTMVKLDEDATGFWPEI